MLSSGLFTGVCGLNANVSEQTVCSETLAFKPQTPVNKPVESIRHSEHGESLKSRKILFYLTELHVSA
jgi:hypothetical protein